MSIAKTGTKIGEIIGIHTIKDIELICNLLQNGKSPSFISKNYKYNRNFIEDIKNRKTWKYISKNYNFDNINSYSEFEKPVVQYDLYLNKINEYDNIKIASIITGTNQNMIGKSCSNKAKSAGGFIWFYKDEDSIDNIIKKKEFIGHNKNIIQYDIDGNFIKHWDTVSQASKQLNIDPSAIIKVCKLKQKTTNGFVFKYAS